MLFAPFVVGIVLDLVLLVFLFLNLIELAKKGMIKTQEVVKNQSSNIH